MCVSDCVSALLDNLCTLTHSLTHSQEVYAALGAPLVRDALKGFNCTLFAYGQTVSE